MPEVQQMMNSNCMGCGNLIKDQYIYKIQPDMQWHESCLKCSECNCRLEENSTCFVRNNRAYCKQDYTRLFAIKCNKCNLGLKRNDLIMKSKSKLYHLECFCCCLCSKKLMPGEEYYQAKDGLLYCKDDSVSILAFNSTNNYSSTTMTPESLLTSSSSSSSSFSPSNGSLSTSSSIVDSPSNNNNNLVYQPIGYNINNNLQHHHHHHQRICEKYTENDSYQDKEEEENSLSDHDETNPGILNDIIDDDDDEEEDDQDVSLSDDDEYEDESITSSSFTNDLNNNKKHKLKTNKHHQSNSNKKLKHTNNNSNNNNLYTSTSSPNSAYLHSCFSSGTSGVGSGSSNGKPARIRTVLNEKQLHTLRACYGANPRPDALMKEQLVEMTGLNPRVIRVWFQNKRCKDKKKNMLVRPNDHHLNIQYNNNNNNTNGGGVSNGNLIQLPTQHSMFDSCY